VSLLRVALLLDELEEPLEALLERVAHIGVHVLGQRVDHGPDGGRVRVGVAGDVAAGVATELEAVLDRLELALQRRGLVRRDRLAALVVAAAAGREAGGQGEDQGGCRARSHCPL